MMGIRLMYEYAATAIGASKLGRQLGRDENGGRSIDRADHADRSRFVERKAKRDRQEQRAEDPELSCRAQQRHLGLREQRAEIDHGAHADKDQQREQLGRNPGIVEHAHDAFSGSHPASGMLASMQPKPMGSNSTGSISLIDRQVDQHQRAP